MCEIILVNNTVQVKSTVISVEILVSLYIALLIELAGM